MASRRLRAAAATAVLLTASGWLPVAYRTAAAGATPVPVAGPPTTPPAQICNDTALLQGPSQPPGSVRVDPSQNLHEVTLANPPGTTFWLSGGTYTLGTGEFGQVVPKQGNVYIGGAGAVLDGQHLNRYAFTGFALNVVIRYLTVTNFAPPFNEAVVNHDAADSWTIEYSTVKNNGGAGLGLGSDNVARYNCVSANGQYGFNAFRDRGTYNIVLDHNEISYNDADDIETTDRFCGCSGGGKFFGTQGAKVTNNWVHHNKSQGLWADTNAVGFLIEGNYINDNTSEGIVYETSYNAFIHNNTLKRNALRKGGLFAARNDAFPVAAIYIQDAGGDARVNGGVYANLEISGNYLEDNWGGVVLWENNERFCHREDSTAANSCPIAGVATPALCVAGTINNPPYLADCRWETQNVQVHDNELHIDKNALNCLNTQCGQMGLFSNFGNNPGWSPYLGTVTQEAITFTDNNHFSANHYFGDWHYDAYTPGRVLDLSEWQAAPYLQDRDSTLIAGVSNYLDADTSTVEGSTGQWVKWFSDNITRSTAEAHGGTHSLKVDITAPYGWGVTLKNHPGFSTNPGAKELSFWAKAGVGSNLGVTMTVDWRGASGASLKTDVLELPSLTSTWQQAKVVVSVPAGTARLNVNLTGSSGNAGDSLFIDDVVVADTAVSPPPPPVNTAGNYLDAETSTIEGTVGQWVKWFSDNVSRSTAEAHNGTSSLRIDVTAPYGWGVTLKNYPGFVATPGNKALSFWAKAGSGAGLGATMSVQWRTASGATIRTDTVELPSLTTAWQQATAIVNAPAGTARVSVDFSNSSGVAGNSLFIDDVVIVDSTVAPPPPPVNFPGNLIDTDTATIEGSALGQWVKWFSDNVSQSATEAHSGTHSMAVDITAQYGWGVTLKNNPGFAAAPGAKTLSFWAKAGSGSNLGATMVVQWRTSTGSVIRTDTLENSGLTSAWKQATASVTAPAGTAWVSVDFSNPSGGPGDRLVLDDIIVSAP